MNIRAVSTAVLLFALAWPQAQGQSQPSASSSPSPYALPSVQGYSSFDNPYAPGGIYDPHRSGQTMNSGSTMGSMASGGGQGGGASGASGSMQSGSTGSTSSKRKRPSLMADEDAAAPLSNGSQGPGACQSALASSGVSRLGMNRRNSMSMLKSHRTIRATMGCDGTLQANSNSSISAAGFNGGDPGGSSLGNGSMNGEDPSLSLKNQLQQLQQMQRVQERLAQQQAPR